MKRTVYLGAACLAAAIAACSQDPTGTATLGGASNAMVNADVASVASDAVGQDVEVMRGPSGLFGFGFRADREKFECDASSRDGLQVTRTCVFKNAAGGVQAAYDSLTTASVSVNATIAGTVTRGPFSMIVERRSDFTVSGLAGKETTAIWNGGGTGKSTRVRQTEDGTTRQYDMTYTINRANVVVPVPRTEGSWPLSGTVTKSFTVKITGGPGDGKTVTRNVVITFNGTSKPVATINGEAWELDLTNRGRRRKG